MAQNLGKLMRSALVHFMTLALSPIILSIQFLLILKAFYAKMSFANIQWISWNTTSKHKYERVLQIITVAIVMFLILGLEPLIICALWFTIIFSNEFFRILIIIYAIYVFYDNFANYNIRRGIGCMYLRNNYFCREYLRNYFPVDLVRTAELKANRNYLLASFPHGFLSIHILVNMVFDIKKWMQLFPGVRPMLGTLDFNLRIPFFRNIIQSIGFISVSKESLKHYLLQSNDPKNSHNADGFTSNAISVLVGGAQEAAETNRNNYTLCLRNRKGFVKIAIVTGAAIVPTFCFGENDLFEQKMNNPDSIVYKYQHIIKNISGIWPIIMIGRGFFQYSFGLLPHRRPLIQVVGSPIEVVKCENPDQSYIDEVHQKVIDGILQIFETYKKQYIADYENVKLIIK